MNIPPIILWFRRDLRLTDNTALNAALRTGSPIIPVFILDPILLKGRNSSAPRLAFLLNALESLDAALRKHGGALLVRHGKPVQEVTRLIEETGATALYFNHDHSPYARRRDGAVQAAMTVPVYSFDDSLLVAPGELAKADGARYTVFTPFKKQWLTTAKTTPETVCPRQDQFVYHQLERFHLISDSPIPVPVASEAVAHQRLMSFVSSAIYVYDNERNRLAADPDCDPIPGTSFLSAYLHLGLLSIREAYWAAQRAHECSVDRSARNGVEAWVGELVWREFYQHILFHFPHVAKGNFRRDYDGLNWRHKPDELLAWKDGRTGYPIVDAAMRQLRQVGWMPNRARMIVASFLTKDLLIDWREGEQHFMRWLVDGDLAANNGGWQWSAGTGTDALPYFRIFNPVMQSKKFDRDGTYIRRWIPELQHVSTAFVHTPWEMAQSPDGYPLPIVEHGFARQRALEAFRTIRPTQYTKE